MPANYVVLTKNSINYKEIASSITGQMLIICAE